MPITKLQAAQQQLDCSIRLLFNEDDMPSVITLSRASFRVLYDIFPVLRPGDHFGSRVGSMIERMGWKKFSEISNQLKHADRDSEAMIEPHWIHAMVGIGVAITFYHQITGARTPEMQAFETLMAALEPEVFAGPHDPEDKGYNDFMKMVARARDATHPELMEMGRGVLHYLKTSKILVKDPNPPSKG